MRFRGLRDIWLLARRLSAGAVAPLIGFSALFLIPILGSIVLGDEEFAFWALLSTISTLGLSLDFGGMAMITARYFVDPRGRLLLTASVLSASGAFCIGILACGAWVFYQDTHIGRGIPFGSAIGAIALVSIASAIRSVLNVVAQAGLVGNKLGLRNFAIGAHATGAVVLTTILLFQTHSFWALPIGWLVPGVLVLSVVIPWLLNDRSSEGSEQSLRQPFSLRQFAGWRTIGTLLSAILINSDRWIIGVLFGPAFLVAYEIAWRFAVLPRFLVQSLVLRVGADVSALSGGDGKSLNRLLHGSTFIAVIAGSLVTIPVAFAYWLFTNSFNLEPSWKIFGAIIVAFTIMGFAAPVSFAGAAVGNAWIDIPYVAGCLIASAIFTGIAIKSGHSMIFLYGYLGTLISLIGYYWAFGTTLVRVGLSNRERIRLTGFEPKFGHSA